MAKKEIISLIDDLDGGDADETVRFGLDGAQYEIDLAEKNATVLREALGPFMVAARRAGGSVRTGRTGRRAPGKALDGDLNERIRAWAPTAGFTVSSKGRIANSVREAYAKAHPGVSAA